MICFAEAAEENTGRRNYFMTHLPSTISSKHNDPRSVYVHVPFCRHRCGYCNFSLVADRDYLIDRFLKALEKEIQWLDRRYEIDTLFLGGGTPSHLPEKDFERLFSILASRFDLSPTAEVTAECNPSDVSMPRITMMHRCGVNRISLGVQSLDVEKLHLLERDHCPETVREAVDLIRPRIDNVSMDLIFAAPDETLDQWVADLDAAIRLGPDHLSTYELTFEKGTQFWNRLNKGALRQSDPDLCAAMYEHTIDRLQEVGMEQYEVSSFANSGRRCRHNLGYWNGRPYFAFGPGAARFIDGVRKTNHGSTMQYLKRVEANQSPVAEVDRMDPRSAAAERLAIGLRQNEGVSRADFHHQTGMRVDEILGDFLVTLVDNHLAVDTPQRLRLTRSGMMMCDRVSVEILSRL